MRFELSYEGGARMIGSLSEAGTMNWTPAPAVFLSPKRDQETIEAALSRDRS